MPWPIIGVIAGVLFSALAAVDWYLSRLDPEREGYGRAVAFLTTGLACLLGAAVLGWVTRTPGAPALASSLVHPRGTATVAEDLTQLDQELKASLALVQKISEGSFEPELPTILDARQRLHAVRVTLSKRPYPSSAASTLVAQSDILLGAAYQTLGIEWILIKLGNWSQPSERETATAPLKRELEKWYTIRDCLRAARDDCGATRSDDPKHVAITEFANWLHPYMVELTRFQESDIDLTIGSPEEISRLRAVFSLARKELEAGRPTNWDRNVVKAADQLLAAADTALSRESTARTKDAWTMEEMQRVNAPVVAAYERMMNAIMEAR